MEHVKLPDLLGKDFIFVSMQDAMGFAMVRRQAQGAGGGGGRVLNCQLPAAVQPSSSKQQLAAV